MKVPFRETVVATAVMLLWSGVASGQQHPAIERCKQTDSDADRIACLEATILAISDGRDHAEPEVALETAPEPEIAVEATPAPEVAVAATPEPEPEVAAVEPETAPPAEEEVFAAAAAEAAALDRADETDIGSEQVDARQQTREEKLARLSEARGLRVERFDKVGFRQLQVYLENGQIWRQIKGDVQEIRVTVERNPTVDITESAIGGYKLRLNEIRRTIRVQRIR